MSGRLSLPHPAWRWPAWGWAAAGSLLLWLALSAGTASFSLASLAGVGVSAAFLTLVALGQMLVIASGNGHIDLSLPGIITLAAFLSLILSGGRTAGLIWALPAVIGAGLASGAVNAFLVAGLRLPAIIATLAVGYGLETASILANRRFTTYGVSPLLKAVVTARLAGVPLMVLIALLAAGLFALLLARTGFGRMLFALGQSAAAADKAGIRRGRVLGAAFLGSGVLAALTGMLLSAYAGGAFLEIGKPYLLPSVGAVVLGGTPIFGGRASAVGCWWGALFLTLLVTTLQLLGLAPGMQDVIEGLIIIAILALGRRTATA
jgi:ribose transport system permease protein